MTTAQDAVRYLEVVQGSDASFRPGQLEAITELVDHRSRVLVIQRTGWGKSLVYFLATRLLRDRGNGPTVIISPLLSLIRDQLAAAGAPRLVAVAIDSTNPDDWAEINTRIEADAVDVLLISPERLSNRQFREETLPAMARGIGMFVVDEAHCISDWGHDFRPDYQRVNRIVGGLPPSVPLLATTATANSRVQRDIEAQLGPDLRTLRGPLSRGSLALQVVELDHQAERFAWLAEYLEQAEGSGIVYTLTTRDADRISEWLSSRGINAPAYHARLQDAATRRPQLEAQLKRNEVKALVATVALGMGFDKPDLAFVAHFQRPGSAVAYYQQIGRAGRALPRAEVVLLSGAEDEAINQHFINSAMPPTEELELVLDAIASDERSTIAGLEHRVNLRRQSIERAIKVLDLEAAVARDDDGWFRTINPWRPDYERGQRLAEQRRAENERMREYVATEACRMVTLTRELDDGHVENCGRCDNCAGPFASTTADLEVARSAVTFLRGRYVPIEPRRQWPAGLEDRRGRIPVERQFVPGRALCRFGDPGLGDLVREGKQGDGGFGYELVEAAAAMFRGWQLEDPPVWVTAIPSLRNPDLVPGLARRVAGRLDLPYRDAIVKVRETPPQKSMQNRYHAARNALDAFAVDPEAVIAEGPVLLVDDMVDSRWSMTVCADLLQGAGSGPVIPFALCDTRGSGSD